MKFQEKSQKVLHVENPKCVGNVPKITITNEFSKVSRCKVNIKNKLYFYTFTKKIKTKKCF